MKKYIKFYFEVFPVMYFGVSLAYAITGMIAGGDHVLSYAHTFFPMALAAACSIVALLTCDSESLSTKQLLFRRILQIVLGEAIVVPSVYYSVPEDDPASMKDLLLVGFFVVLVYILVRFVLWFTAYWDTEDLNRKLKVIKENDDDDSL